MALNPNPSKLDQQQILQRVLDGDNDRLRVDAAVSATVSDITVVMDAATDSVAIGDGVKEATITTVAGKNSLDVNVTQSALPSGAATSANQATEITSLQLIDDSPHANNATLNKGAPLMGQLDDTSTILATEDNVSVARITAQRALHANLRDTSGIALGTTANPLFIGMTDSPNLEDRISELSVYDEANNLLEALLEIGGSFWIWKVSEIVSLGFENQNIFLPAGDILRIKAQKGGSTNSAQNWKINIIWGIV